MILYFLTSGVGFFSGILLIIGSIALDLAQNKWLRSLRRLLLALGIVATVVCAPPLPIWIFVFASVPVLIYLVVCIRSSVKKRWHRTSGILLATSCIALAIIELPHCLTPQNLLQTKKLYLLGDSLSAGIGERHITIYSHLLNENKGTEIINLAHSGAQTVDGLNMAKKVLEADTPVLIELGGNDWRRGSDSGKKFRQSLDRLLAKVCNGRRVVIMFELPFPPFSYEFTYAQRELAAQYDIILIPKRFFARILFLTPDATTDSLHFSQIGHQMMADGLATILWHNP